MRKFLLVTLGFAGLLAVAGTSAFAMSKTCEAIFDRCTASAGDHWEKCIFMADRCEIELRKQQEREEAKKHPPDAVTGAGKRVPRGSKGPSKREAGGTRSGSGEYEVTYRSASGGNGKIIWVVMPDGSTVAVEQGVPGGAFLTKVIDGKTYSVEFVKTVDGVSYNVADPAYEAAVAASKQKLVANRSKLGGAVAGAPARPPGGQLPRGNGQNGDVLSGSSATSTSGNAYVGAGNANNAAAIPGAIPGTTPSTAPGAISGASSATTPGRTPGTTLNKTPRTMPDLAGAATRKFP